MEKGRTVSRLKKIIMVKVNMSKDYKWLDQVSRKEHGKKSIYREAKASPVASCPLWSDLHPF